MATVKKVKKAQKGIRATADSSAYYKNLASRYMEEAARSMGDHVNEKTKAAFKKSSEATSNEMRQKRKGMPGYDANGFPIKKNKTGGKVRKAQDGFFSKLNKKPAPSSKVMTQDEVKKRTVPNKPKPFDLVGSIKKTLSVKKERSGGKVTKAKAGKQMLKRADGSYSQRGLWDNIRAAKGSGKKPTKAMLKQEKKIKAKTK
jgi:hypothetical protein